MNNELLQPTETLNTWWSLSPEEQSEIEKTIPEHTTLTLPITKHKSGVWTLSLPQWKTLNESLTGGTEKVIDLHYKDVIGVDLKQVTNSSVPCLRRNSRTTQPSGFG